MRDNLNAQVSDAMKELIACRDWPTVYQLPPYAHELNPVELDAVPRPALLDGFLASTRLGLTPFCNPHP